MIVFVLQVLALIALAYEVFERHVHNFGEVVGFGLVIVVAVILLLNAVLGPRIP